MLHQLQAQWKTAGIEAKINTFDQTQYAARAAVGQYQATWYRGFAFPNPDTDSVFFSSETLHPVGSLSINFNHFTSPSLDANIEIARSSADFAPRKAANDAIIKETNQQVLSVWLFDTPYAIAASPKLRGLDPFRTHPFGNFEAKPWWGTIWVQP